MPASAMGYKAPSALVASFFGADFYGLSRNTDQITLEKTSWIVPNELALGDNVVVPLRAGQAIQWRMVR